MIRFGPNSVLKSLISHPLKTLLDFSIACKNSCSRGGNATEFAWNMLRSSDASQADDAISSFPLFLCGLAAGTCAKVVCHPLDVVKKRFQDYKGTRDMALGLSNKRTQIWLTPYVESLRLPLLVL